MPSPEYSNLKMAIAELETGLMGFSSRADGAYTSEELLKCQAFVVFSHAEIENYLEKIARRIMHEAKTRWETTFIPDRVIATLLAYRRKEVIGPPLEFKNSTGKANIKEIVKTSLKLQDEAISGNNGIKMANLSELLCPLGVLQDDVDEVLLIQLTNIGSKRGDFVHKQSKVSLPKIRDPFSDEQQDIHHLIEELGKFDAKLEALGLLSAPISASTPLDNSAGESATA